MADLDRDAIVEAASRAGAFRDHGHDPAGCNVIVCWEHNGEDCPVEILELRSILDQLEG
jgi:hypothetical protein